MRRLPPQFAPRRTLAAMSPSKEAELAEKARRYRKAREEKKAKTARREARSSRRQDKARAQSPSTSPRLSSGFGVLRNFFSGGRSTGEMEELLGSDRSETDTATTYTAEEEDAYRGLSSKSSKDRASRKGKKIGVEQGSDSDDELFQQLRRPRGASESARGYQKLTRDALLSLDEAEKGVSVGLRVPGPSGPHSFSTTLRGVIPRSWRTWAATASVSFSCFTVGLAVGFPFAVKKTMLCVNQSECVDGVESDEAETLQSALFAGTILGALCAGWMCDRFGRRQTIVFAPMIAVIGWAMVFVAEVFSSTALAGKVFIGASVGFVTTSAPLLLAEASRKVGRGAHAILPNSAIVKGVLFMYLAPLSPVSVHWRHLALVCCAFNFIACVVAWMCVVESPRWYIARAMHLEAVDALTTLRGAWTERDTMNDAATIIGRENAKTSPAGAFAGFRWWHLITHAHFLRSMMILCTLVGIQQLSGLSLAVQDDGEIPPAAGVPSSPETRIAYVITMMFGIVVCSRMVDIVGRRACMLTSLAGMFVANVSMACITAGYALGSPDAAVNVAVISFAFFNGLGTGAIPMLIGVEIFPQHARATALGLACALYWAYVFVESFAYDLALNVFTVSAIHVFYATVCALGAAFVHSSIPETATKSIEEVVEMFAPSRDTTLASALAPTTAPRSRKKSVKRVAFA